MNETISQFLDKEFEEIKRTHQLTPLFERYRSLHGKKLDNLKEKFNVDKNLIVAAIYCSDYIIVASEIKEQIADEEREKEIIELFRLAEEKAKAQEQKLDWKLLTYSVAFIYHMASLIRKRYYFMLDKGVEKNVAAAQVGDLIVFPVLEYCKEKVKLDYKWLSILMRAALTQTTLSYAKEKLERYFDITETELSYLLPQIIVQSMPEEIEGETNRAVPLQYFKETEAFYLVKADNKEFYACKKNDKPKYINEFKKIIPLLSYKYTHNMKYLRLDTKLAEKTPMSLFLIHSNTEKAEGWLVLYSPIDDINLSLAEELLKLKLNQITVMEENKKILPKLGLVKEQVKAKPKEKAKPKAKRSLWQKLLSIFKRKTVEVKEEPKKVEVAKEPINEFKKLFVDQFVVALVSGIDLGINVYDAYREHEFEINGILESSLDLSPPTIFYAETQIAYPSELLEPVISTLEFSKNYIKEITSEKIEKIIPEEAFFEVKDNPEASRLVEFEYSENRIIGIVADKYIETHLLAKKNTPYYKRRTIIKKVREALSARKRNKMEDVITSLFSNDIKPSMLQKSTEDKLLFYMQTEK